MYEMHDTIPRSASVCTCCKMVPLISVNTVMVCPVCDRLREMLMEERERGS